MKKSQVVFDLEKILSRLDDMKGASCLKLSTKEIDEIVDKIEILISQLSCGATFSITGRENPTLPKQTCRFCGR